MQTRLILAVSVLLGGTLWLPAQAEVQPVHQITCASPSTARAYAEALRQYHAGQYDAAIRGFQEIARHESDCAMAHFGLSRAFQRSGRPEAALTVAEQAEAQAAGVDNRERQFISLWLRYLKAQGAPDAERRKQVSAIQRDLDLTLALYPEDPELWILRGDLSESPLRATPYYLAALRLQPGHPFGSVWKPTPPPAPRLTPAATQPVAPLAETPPLFAGLGELSHPVKTRSQQAREYYEQGLRLMHGYVMPGQVKNSAAVSFQHAANLDPNCAMAYWGLSFCNTRAMKQVDAANRALELALQQGDDREIRFCAARVLELGGQQQREAFLDALDGAIAAYPDDVELWIWRGKVYGVYGAAGNNPAAMPFQLAAYALQPTHPSPPHELVHLYEAINRPALGWPFSVALRKSAPNLPHANHMQAHLAMRIGRWQDAIDATRVSRQKSLEGFPELDPSHHIDILVRALAHEGRFREAEAEPKAYRDGLPWARLLQLKADVAELDQWAARRRERNAPDGFYIGAIVRLDQGDLEGARPFVANVEEQFKKNSRNMYRHHEVKGRFLVQSGQVEEGLKLLRQAGAQAVKDDSLHAWGGGSYMLEVWGEAALRARRWDEAEEAFHEALAHEHGSIVGALGMQVVAEQRGDAELVEHYARRAQVIWKDADPGALDRQLVRLRKLVGNTLAAQTR